MWYFFWKELKNKQCGNISPWNSAYFPHLWQEKTMRKLTFLKGIFGSESWENTRIHRWSSFVGDFAHTKCLWPVNQEYPANINESFRYPYTVCKLHQWYLTLQFCELRDNYGALCCQTSLENKPCCSSGGSYNEKPELFRHSKLHGFWHLHLIEAQISQRAKPQMLQCKNYMLPCCSTSRSVNILSLWPSMVSLIVCCLASVLLDKMG